MRSPRGVGINVQDYDTKESEFELPQGYYVLSD